MALCEPGHRNTLHIFWWLVLFWEQCLPATFHEHLQETSASPRAFSTSLLEAGARSPSLDDLRFLKCPDPSLWGEMLSFDAPEVTIPHVMILCSHRFTVCRCIWTGSCPLKCACLQQSHISELPKDFIQVPEGQLTLMEAGRKFCADRCLGKPEVSSRMLASWRGERRQDGQGGSEGDGQSPFCCLLGLWWLQGCDMGWVFPPASVT